MDSEPAAVTVHACTFGPSGQGHDLQASSLGREDVPEELFGLTDRPREIPAGSDWEYLVSSGPIGDYWALSVTVPAPHERQGMVQSHVRLIELDQLALIADLTPIIESLPRTHVPDPVDESFDVPSRDDSETTDDDQNEVARFLNAWIDGDLSRPIVVSDLERSLRVLNSLWKLLPGRVRGKLVLRTELTPELTDGDDVDSIVATPVNCAPRWAEAGYTVLADASPSPSTSPFVDQLLHGQRSELGVLTTSSSLGLRREALSRFSRLATGICRAADGSATFDDLLALRRRADFLGADESAAIKSQSIQQLAPLCADAKANQLGSLANLPMGSDACLDELAAAVERRASQIDHASVVSLIERLARDGEEWWKTATVAGLATRLQLGSDPDTDLVLEMIAAGDGAANATTIVLQTMSAPHQAAFELRLATRVTDKRTEVPLLDQFAIDMGWPTLFGTVLAHREDIAAAISQALAFEADPAAAARGVARAASEDVLLAYASNDLCADAAIDPIGDAIVERRIRLDGFRADRPAWRRLLVVVSKATEDPWRLVPNGRGVLFDLLSLLSRGEDIEPEAIALISDSDVTALDIEDRAALWRALPAAIRDQLIERTAKAWTKAAERGEDLELDERLARIVLKKTTSARVLLAVLKSGYRVDDRQCAGVIERLQPPRSAGPTLLSVGREVNRARLQKTARAITDRFNEDVFGPAAIDLRNFASYLMRWRIPYSHDEKEAAEDNMGLLGFYSYSHEDEELRDELAKHLKLLERKKLFRAWHDRKISPGVDFDHEIDAHLEEADIILLLVSASFLSSDYIHGVELKCAMDRHRDGSARVIPIILRDCIWHEAEFSSLLALPTDGNAVESGHWENQDEAFTVVAKGILEVVREIQAGSQ